MANFNFNFLYRFHCLKSVQIRSYLWCESSFIWTEYGDLWDANQRWWICYDNLINFWYLFFLCLIGGWHNFSGLLVGRVKCDVCRKLALSTSYHIKNLIFSRQWARQEIRFYVYLFCCSCFIFLFFVLVDCFSQNVCCFCYCFIIHGIGWHTMLSYQKQLIVNVCNVCPMIVTSLSLWISCQPHLLDCSSHCQHCSANEAC